MVNGVLVEKTVKDVIPALKTNSDGLKKILEELLKQYKKQQDEMEKWKVRRTPLTTESFYTSSHPHCMSVTRSLGQGADSFGTVEEEQHPGRSAVR
jgi:hypothetical protein